MDLSQLNLLISELCKISEIQSIYAYGSVLNDDFNPLKSDIDLLIIAREKNAHETISKIREIKEKFHGVWNLDLNICFASEFNLRIHVNRPPTYYFGIAQRNKLLFGESLLESVKTDKIDPKKIYERVANLAQAARALYLNREEKDADFWIKYQRKWLVVAFLEVLFLDGHFELNKSKGLNYFIKSNNAPSEFLNLLDLHKTDVELLFRASEWLRVYLLSSIAID